MRGMYCIPFLSLHRAEDALSCSRNINYPSVRPSLLFSSLLFSLFHILFSPISHQRHHFPSPSFSFPLFSSFSPLHFPFFPNVSRVSPISKKQIGPFCPAAHHLLLPPPPSLPIFRPNPPFWAAAGYAKVGDDEKGRKMGTSPRRWTWSR